MPRSPSNETRLIILPFPWASIGSAAARHARYTPVRLTSSTRRHSTGVTSGSGLAKMRSWALIRMSSRPSSETVRRTSVVTSDSLVVSILWANPGRLRAWIALRQEVTVAASRLLGRRVVTATLAPASARAIATAPPIGLDAPITRAALSCKENSSRPITPLLPATERLVRNTSVPGRRLDRHLPTRPSRHSYNWLGPRPRTHRADLTLHPYPPDRRE